MTAVSRQMMMPVQVPKGLVLATLFLAVIALATCSMILGYTGISWQDVTGAFSAFDGSREHIVVLEMRFPRAVLATLVGASLGVAGLFMQGLTRNPLASPCIFGINAGASLAIVVATAFFGVTSHEFFALFAMVGAAATACVVYFLGMSTGNLTPLNLTLAGVAVNAFLASITSGILVFNESVLDEVLFWLSGSIEGRRLDLVVSMIPVMVAGWLVAFLLAKSMNAQALGDDIAKSLGQKTVRVKLAACLVVVSLAGISVAMAGPIGFAGLIAPHFARALLGLDYRWLIPGSMFIGASLLLSADVLARFIVWPQEVPVGVAMSLIGAPFFIAYARRSLTT
ncbi:FecCD family ABC transporter permease [Endozoicomonas montiporae]|nr:iron ABC transporter permease [Endozoicomonas montiporae]AMO54526.1 transport system permease [Endozoicomonas montiporae CL-33]